MAEFVHDGLTLWFEEHGAGTPVVFLSGTMGDHTQWDIVVPQLSGLRAITPDNRDIGNSSLALRDYSVAEMAGDVLALLDHLRLPRAHIVGHSLGGQVAQQLALAAPQRVDRLVLVATTARHDTYSRSLLEHWERLRLAIADDVVFTECICLSAMGQGVRSLVSLRTAAEMWLMKTSHQRPAALVRNIHASLGCDTLDRLPALRMPTLVIWSDHDAVFPASHAARLLAAIPGAEGARMPGLGHAPMAERPTEFARLLQQFLS